jgi:hypothetical protein
LLEGEIFLTGTVKSGLSLIGGLPTITRITELER